MREIASLLLALSLLLLPQPILADSIQLGNVSIAIPKPLDFLEDDSFLATIRKASPQDIVIHKMLIPYSGIKQSGKKRVLLDYILITTLVDGERNLADAGMLNQLEAIRDKRYGVADQVSHGYSREENRLFFEALESSGSNDGIFLEKDTSDDVITYYTLMDTKGKEYRVVSATTFLVVKGRLVTLGAYSRIRGRAIYNSLKIVKNMTRKVVANLRNNNPE